MDDDNDNASAREMRQMQTMVVRVLTSEAIEAEATRLANPHDPNREKQTSLKP